jgi:uncharacterized protein (DUF1330 family)
MGSNQGHGVLPPDDMLQDMLASDDPNPIVMVNLLKVKDQQALDRYSRMVFPLIERYGGSLVHSGPVADAVIGDSTWDLVAVVRYPSRKAFAEAALSEDYAAAAPHRVAGLERAELIMTDG